MESLGGYDLGELQSFCLCSGASSSNRYHCSDFQENNAKQQRNLKVSQSHHLHLGSPATLEPVPTSAACHTQSDTYHANYLHYLAGYCACLHLHLGPANPLMYSTVHTQQHDTSILLATSSYLPRAYPTSPRIAPNTREPPDRYEIVERTSFRSHLGLKALPTTSEGRPAVFPLATSFGLWPLASTTPPL